jgi:predicted GTPase
MADVVVITKQDTASPASVERVRQAARTLAPSARVLDVRLPITVDDPAAVRGRRVLAVDDGPTLTHGGMPSGAAQLAAERLGAILVDPRPYARGSLRAVFASYPRLGPVLPAMGYGKTQIGELQATIDATACDVVLVGTPLDLRRSLEVRHPVVRARYEAEACGPLTFADVVGDV